MIKNDKTTTKPTMKLFTIGPVEMYPHTIDVRSKTIPYFRTPEFSEMMLDNETLMKTAVDADENAKVVFLTASGSGAMEAAVWNCFNENDKLLVISGGTFGERFEKICEIHHIPFSALKLNANETLTAEHLSAYDSQGFTGLLVNLHETYTGQLYDIQMIHDFCQRNHLYLIVDAISTFLCDEYSMKKCKADVTIISSQKGLCLAPGLSMVVLSERIINEKVFTNQPETLYFNFKDYLLNMKRGQTPFTPGVGICYELNDMLHHIKEQGIENRINEVKERCNYFRSKIKELPVSLPEFPLSNAITPVKFGENIAMELYQYLKDQKSIVVNPIGGELGKSAIRVSHVGNLTFSDYDLLIAEINEYLKQNHYWR